MLGLELALLLLQLVEALKPLELVQMLLLLVWLEWQIGLVLALWPQQVWLLMVWPQQVELMLAWQPQVVFMLAWLQQQVWSVLVKLVFMLEPVLALSQFKLGLVQVPLLELFLA